MIQRVAEIVAAALALGGGMLLEIAPPASDLESLGAIGRNRGFVTIAATLLYLILLGWVHYSRPRMHARSWLKMATWFSVGGVAFLLSYLAGRSHFTVNVNDLEFLIGMWRDQNWATHNPQLATASSQVIVDTLSMQAAYKDVWLDRSRVTCYLVMMSWYTVATLLILCSLFCVLEGYFNTFWSREVERQESNDRQD